MRSFNYDITFKRTEKRKGTSFFSVDYYNTRKERLLFSQSEILDCQKQITDRLGNVSFFSKVEYAETKKIFDFLQDNRLQIVKRLFYDGYIVIDAKKLEFADLTGRTISHTYGDRLQIPLEDTECAYVSETFESTGLSDYHFLKDKIRFLDAVNSSDFNLIENYGAMGIVSPETDGSMAGAEFTEDDVKDLQERYQKHYGISVGKWSLMFVPRPTKYSPIQLPIAALQLSEKRKYAIQCIYSALGIPKEIGVYFDNSTYENRRQAELDFYNGTISKWANTFVKIAEVIYQKDMELYSEYLKNEFWFRFVDVAVLQEANKLQKETATIEIDFWEGIISKYPEYAETAKKNIKDLIESL